MYTLEGEDSQKQILLSYRSSSIRLTISFLSIYLNFSYSSSFIKRDVLHQNSNYIYCKSVRVRIPIMFFLCFFFMFFFLVLIYIYFLQSRLLALVKSQISAHSEYLSAWEELKISLADINPPLVRRRTRT